jgi:hypothetical protein
MGSTAGMELLQLPVQLRDIRLGRPVDLLLDAKAWRVLGFVVLCGDESLRFLAYPAADLREGEIAVPSALLLLEDVEFYRERTRSLRALLGSAVASDGRHVGPLHDLCVAPDGNVDALLVIRDGFAVEIEPAGARIELAPAA